MGAESVCVATIRTMTDMTPTTTNAEMHATGKMATEKINGGRNASGKTMNARPLNSGNSKSEWRNAGAKKKLTIGRGKKNKRRKPTS